MTNLPSASDEGWQTERNAAPLTRAQAIERGKAGGMSGHDAAMLFDVGNFVAEAISKSETELLALLRGEQKRTGNVMRAMLAAQRRNYVDLVDGLAARINDLQQEVRDLQDKRR